MGQQASTPQAPQSGGGGQGGPSWLGSLGQSLSSTSLVTSFQVAAGYGSSSSASTTASNSASADVVMKVRRVYLDLSNRSLKGLIPPPHELEEFIRPSFSSSGNEAEFIYLEALSLAHNQLTFLGDGLLQIKHLPLLMELDVSHNQLDTLDEGTLSSSSSSSLYAHVCELMGTLERLNLAHNRLAYLPPNMYLLHNLRELNVGHNDIVYLPEELSHLQQLHYLNIAANNLYSLPDSCGKLRGLKTLILCNNQLEVVSPRLGELSQLTWLDISWNRLDAFPRNLPESLKKLYAGNNRIRSIEGDVIRRLRNLKELSLPSNKLTRLPRELLDLVDSLKVLDVEDNRFSERDLTTTEILTSFTKARSQPSTPQEERRKAGRPASAYAPRDPGFFVEGYSNHLYRLKGKDRIVMQAVEVNISSLNEGDSFLLDIGRKLFVWIGSQSNPRERAKAKYIANLLSAEELAGIPVIVINEEDDPEFWETIGGRRVPIKGADKGGDDAEVEARFADSMVLYKFSQGLSGPQVDVIEGFEMPFYKSLLNHHYSYVLHCQQNIFVWCGKDCSSKDRIRAHAKAEEIANQVGENAFADISWQIDGAETIFFREQFVDWNDEADWQPELDRELGRQGSRSNDGGGYGEQDDYADSRERERERGRERERTRGGDDAYSSYYDAPEPSHRSKRDKPVRKPAAQPQKDEDDEGENEDEEDTNRTTKKKTRKQIREAKQQQTTTVVAPAAAAGSGLVKNVGADDWKREMERKKEAERADRERRQETLRKREAERADRERREQQERQQRVQAERKREEERQQQQQREEQQRRQREADEQRRRKEEAERQSMTKREQELDRKRRDEEERQRQRAQAQRQREAVEQRQREAELEARKKRDDEARQQAAAASVKAEPPRPTGGSVIASRTSGGSTIARTKQVGGLTVEIDVCESCQKRVYLTEKISVEGKSFHKNCFRCTHCNNPLKPGNYASLQGKPYCKPHFKQLFQLKGNYSSGFGELTPEQAWKSKNDAPAAATIPTAIPATKDEPKGKGKAATSGAASTSASITVTPPASTSAASVRAVAVEIATHPPAKIYDDTVLRLARDFPELGMDRVEEAVNLFDKWDTRGSGRLNKAQFLRLMQQVIGANKFARGPIYQRLVELSFDYVDTGKKGSLDKRQFLVSYNLLFSNERKQMALLLTKDFKGLTVEEIEDGLKKFEQQEKVDMDEFYQLKEELDDNLKRILKQILNIVEPGAADTKIVSALKTSLECLPVEEVKPTPVTATTTTATTSTAPRPVGQAPPSQRVATIRATDGSPDALWNEFRTAEKLLDVVRSFEALKKACGVDADLQGVEVFNIIKTKVVNKNAETFWKLLEHRMAQATPPAFVEYQTGFKASPPRAVIVGSGPGGLRTAIEFAFLGVRATVLEKRLDYSRNNLLHIWHSSIRDLKNIGAKYFYPQFCTGGINHIAIRSLQILLLKVALLLGVKFLPGVGYVKTDDSRHRAKPQSGLWQVVVAAQGKPDFVDYRDDDLAANIIVGADGENSLVAKDFDFERKVLQGSRAIGITANFVNTHTSAENQIKEFGILRVYNQQFFNDLNSKYGIDLENLVYYRGETHYFVMTAMIKSLLDKKVLREMQTDASLLLSRDNLDVQKLRSFVTEVADHTGLPSTCPFAPNHAGAEDVAIFDFSKKQQSITPFKIVGDQEGNKLLVALVGDALIEPFWPLGTGANRAILSALDTTWMVKGMYGNGAKQVSCAQLKQLETQWQESFKIMMNSSPDDLVSNFGLHTIDPKTRYKKNSMSRFH